LIVFEHAKKTEAGCPGELALHYCSGEIERREIFRDVS